jgi:tetraacyldisaccharide 4'-kinase
VARALTELWYGKARGAALLAPVGWLYGALMTLRRGAYAAGLLRRHTIGCPVVVVGNLTVGGSGKTPLVAWLAGELSGRGYHVGIVSRGYGSQSREPRLVGSTATWQEVGDEPLLLARRTGCSTAVGVDRVATARLLKMQGCDVIVSDDGLQHLRLAADYRIVVVDGARGFGNRRVLPAGPLREPLAGLACADAIIVNGAAPDAAQLHGARAGTPLLEMRLVPAHAVGLVSGARRPLTEFRATPVHAVAGIGHPGRFFHMLRGIGLQVIEHAFADHHPLGPEEVEFADELPVLMTEKDAVKCTGFANARLWSVPVSAQLVGEGASRLLAPMVERFKTFRR